MRTCPYCAQQVDDQAMRCPYCQNALGPPAPADPRPAGPPPAGVRPVGPPVAPVAAPGPGPDGPTMQGPPPPPPAPAAVVGEGALRFSHSGERYILGYGTDFFGIWDRFVAGPAVMRFARTDQGWAEAWGQFAAREPNAVAVPGVGAAPAQGGAASSAVYRDAHGRAVLLMVLLGAACLVALVVAGIAFGILRDLERGQVGVLTAVDRATSAIGFAALLQIATIVTWCMWEFRARSNLDAFGVSGLSVSPGWSVGWWFIPIANLFMPYRAMSEVLRGSLPSGGSSEWKRSPTGLLLPFWWAALIAGWLVSQVANSTVGQSTGPVVTISGTITSLQWIAIGQLLIAVAAVLAILVVREVDRRQTERRRVAMGEAATSPGYG
jgi:hypothetical protein